MKEKGKGKQQATVNGLFERQRPYSLDHCKSKALSYCIAEMMALDLQPFSLVEDPGSCPLMREVDPRYSIPSRRYSLTFSFLKLTLKSLPLSQLLKSTQHISVIWSSGH